MDWCLGIVLHAADMRGCYLIYRVERIWDTLTVGWCKLWMMQVVVVMLIRHTTVAFHLSLHPYMSAFQIHICTGSPNSPGSIFTSTLYSLLWTSWSLQLNTDLHSIKSYYYYLFLITLVYILQKHHATKYSVLSSLMISSLCCSLKCLEVPQLFLLDILMWLYEKWKGVCPWDRKKKDTRDEIIWFLLDPIGPLCVSIGRSHSTVQYTVVCTYSPSECCNTMPAPTRYVGNSHSGSMCGFSWKVTVHVLVVSLSLSSAYSKRGVPCGPLWTTWSSFWPLLRSYLIVWRINILTSHF